MNKKAVLAFFLAGLILVLSLVGLLLNTSSSTDASIDRTPPLAEDSAEVTSVLPLFKRLNESYARGSQPNQGGVTMLARLGVRRIVDLRSNYDHTEDIEAIARKLGIEYRRMPMSVWDPPTDEQANEFVKFVGDGSKGPIFVFCADGLHRTGEMTAIYRVAHDGWTVERALAEMDELGFNPYYWSLRQYVWTYARKFRPESVPPNGRSLSSTEK